MKSDCRNYILILRKSNSPKGNSFRGSFVVCISAIKTPKLAVIVYNPPRRFLCKVTKFCKNHNFSKFFVTKWTFKRLYIYRGGKFTLIHICFLKSRIKISKNMESCLYLQSTGGFCAVSPVILHNLFHLFLCKATKFRPKLLFLKFCVKKQLSQELYIIEGKTYLYNLAGGGKLHLNHFIKRCGGGKVY